MKNKDIETLPKKEIKKFEGFRETCTNRRSVNLAAVDQKEIKITKLRKLWRRVNLKYKIVFS